MADEADEADCVGLACAEICRVMQSGERAVHVIHKKASAHKINFFINFIITGMGVAFLSDRR